MRRLLFATSVALSISPTALAATTPAAGFIYGRETLSQLTEGCVAHAPGGDFVGVGPALSFPAAGSTRSILFVSESGAVRTVATGLNSIGDCVYDAVSDILYVTDSGFEFSGATGGDTVFAIPGSSTATPVTGLEVLPSGSIPYAFSIDRFGNGLLVSNAAGGGAGTVIAIDQSGATPAMSTFASGFDYTGGIAVDGSRVLVSESIDPTFASSIYAYSSAGVLQATVAGPGYGQGSADLAIARDGGILATGAPTLVELDSGGTATPLVTGLDGGTGFDAFGGGVSVDAFTGRIDFLASSFSGANDDRSLHRLIPVDRLVAGGGNPPSDCAMELYGLELTASVPGKPLRSAVCVDGSVCDADGKVDGGCTFPLGLCFSVNDSRLASCTPAPVASVEVLGAKPDSAALAALVAAASATLPNASAGCVFGDGIRIPVVSLPNGGSRAGKGLIRLRAVTDEDSPRKDTDVARLVCQPAA